MFTRIILYVLFLCTFLNYSAQPPRKWVEEISGGGVKTINAITVDKKGAVYIYGSFGGVVDFDPSSTQHYLTSTSTRDLYLLKLNSEGVFIWVKSIGSAISNQYINLNATALECDGDSICYLAGIFRGVIDFDPGINSTFTMSAPISDNRGFVVSLDTAGNFRWAKKIDGLVTIKDLCIGVNGNVQGVGEFKGQVDFDPDTAATYNQSSGSNNAANAFIFSINRKGILRWVRSLQGPQPGCAYSVAYDTVNKKYCFGGSAGVGTDMNPGPGNLYSGEVAGFVCELDSSGNNANVALFDGLCTISSVVYNSGILISGTYSGTVDIDPSSGVNILTCSQNSSNGLIVRLTGGLTLTWVRELKSSGFGLMGSSLLMINKNNHIYYFSFFQGSYDLDPSLAVYNISYTPGPTPSQSFDYVFAEYDTNCSLLWGYNIGPCWSTNPLGYATPYGAVYLSNVYSGNVEIDPGSASYTLASNASTSMFVELLTMCQGTTMPQVNISATNTLICAGEFVGLTANGADHYQWSHGPSVAGTGINPNSTGIYEVMGTDSAGCSSLKSILITVDACTGLRVYSAAQGSTAYPNPTNSLVHVNAKPGTQITVHDETGKLMLKTTADSSGTSAIDISNLTPGIYTILSFGEKGREVTRVVLR